MPELKKCSACLQHKTLENFQTYIERNGKPAKYSLCKPCTSERSMARYRINNPRKIVKDLEGEIWKEVEGYYGDYEVSNMGRVKSWKFGRGTLLSTKKSYESKVRYLKVSLYLNDVNTSISLHRLVAKAFCEGESEEKNQINHIDWDTFNNKSSNLEWCDASHNIKDTFERNGRKFEMIVTDKEKIKDLLAKGWAVKKVCALMDLPYHYVRYMKHGVNLKTGRPM